MMRFGFLPATLLLMTFICHAAQTPLQCASAPTSQSNDVIYFRVTASTNTPPVCYTVSRSGTVIRETGPSRFQATSGPPGHSDLQGSIPASLAKEIFGDVEAAMPLSSLPKTRCAKSVSFGTSRHVFFNGEKSPDLCGNDAKIEMLKSDLAKIMSSASFEQSKP